MKAKESASPKHNQMKLKGTMTAEENIGEDSGRIYANKMACVGELPALLLKALFLELC